MWKAQGMSLCVETPSYQGCRPVHWYQVDLLVLQVLWAPSLPSRQEILPKQKMMEREQPDIKKLIMQHVITFERSVYWCTSRPSLPRWPW